MSKYNYDETEIKVYSTTEYGMFKKLLGNREVTDNRVNAIKDSIEKIGYQPIPILVNEKFEVIDGQGRLSACEQLNLPILFEIKEGVGIEECIAMNIKMQNWNIYDYINSYVAKKIKDYEVLNTYADDNTSSISIIEIAMCLSDDSWSRNVNRPLRNGTYKISESAENIGCLEFIKEAVNYIDKIQGGHREYIPILIGLYKFNLIDDCHMLDAIKNYSHTMGSAYNANDALEELQKVYNYRRSKITRFRDTYLDKMESKGARYKCD